MKLTFLRLVLSCISIMDKLVDCCKLKFVYHFCRKKKRFKQKDMLVCTVDTTN